MSLIKRVHARKRPFRCREHKNGGLYHVYSIIFSSFTPLLNACQNAFETKVG